MGPVHRPAPDIGVGPGRRTREPSNRHSRRRHLVTRPAESNVVDVSEPRWGRWRETGARVLRVGGSATAVHVTGQIPPRVLLPRGHGLAGFTRPWPRREVMSAEFGVTCGQRIEGRHDHTVGHDTRVDTRYRSQRRRCRMRAVGDATTFAEPPQAASVVALSRTPPTTTASHLVPIRRSPLPIGSTRTECPIARRPARRPDRQFWRGLRRAGPLPTRRPRRAAAQSRDRRQS